MIDLSEMFASKRSNVIEWEGDLLYGLYELESVADRFSIEFLAAKTAPVQGVNLKIRGGVLIVNDVKAEDVVLWADTAPPKVEVRVDRRGRSRALLKVWNVWRGGADVTHAWLGNSAMRVTVSDDGQMILLRCSDGDGVANFEDLTVRLELH